MIPLCIRPLRLVLPSDKLRSARIVLLKATHLPFVAVIWAYEQLAVYRRNQSTSLSFSGPRTQASSRRPPKLAVNAPRLLMADSQAAIPSPSGRGQAADRPLERAEQPESDVLRTLVMNLTTQVETLTVMVSELQKEQREANRAA